jgi:glutamate--cysteine ligase
MIPSLEKRLKKFNTQPIIQSLTGIRRGFEKECLRVDQEGMLAKTRHPEKLGSSLTHPMITTDYSEALLEFITPPTSDIADLFQTLQELHCYTYATLNNEYLWSASMPCRLPPENEIPIAYYGTSNIGRLKHIYRVGLGHRYGRCMQTIAGIHYNFSFSDDFWARYAPLINPTLSGSAEDKSQFVSEQYLGLIRNALRFSWILPLLFGASPAVCGSFLKKNNIQLQAMNEHTLFLPSATSLRLSDLGYHNKTKPKVEISYNSFRQFIKTMQDAVHTPDPEFARLGVKKDGEYQQLSDSIFQTEAEHYSLFRPKRVSQPNERTLQALNRSGIEYIEIRALDLDPFVPLGVEPKTVYILDTFLLLCLLLDSPPITPEENERIQYNHAQVVHRGRDDTLKLRTEDNEERLCIDWANEIISSLAAVAELLDTAYASQTYTRSVQSARQSIAQLDTLASAKMLAEMQYNKETYFEFVDRWSRLHQQHFEKTPFSTDRLSFYRNLAKESWVAQQAIEQSDTLSFDEFVKNFLV